MQDCGRASRPGLFAVHIDGSPAKAVSAEIPHCRLLRRDGIRSAEGGWSEFSGMANS
ncbi:MAG: hypothetical protein ACKPJD_30560 [Planctomycetaceae bacterium]